MEERVTQEAVLRELAAIGFARVTDYLSVKDGVLEVKTIDELLPDGAAAVASVEKTSTGIKIKFYTSSGLWSCWGNPRDSLRSGLPRRWGRTAFCRQF